MMLPTDAAMTTRRSSLGATCGAGMTLPCYGLSRRDWSPQAPLARALRTARLLSPGYTRSEKAKLLHLLDAVSRRTRSRLVAPPATPRREEVLRLHGPGGLVTRRRPATPSSRAGVDAPRPS